MSSQRTEGSFSRVRSWIFPVHSNELKKLVLMGLLMALISFSFWLLHISKDTLIITAKHSGAEVINFLKLPVFLVSILFVMGYTWFSNIFQQATIFYIIISFFAIFFLVFTYFIYPNQDTLNLFTGDEIAHLQVLYPWVKWLFPVIGYWGYSLFYIVSELWGALVLSLLFWQFANQITTIDQSHRFYMFFGSFNGIGTILAGLFVMYYESDPQSLDAYGAKLHHLMLILFFLCLCIIAIYHWIYKDALRDSHPSREKKNQIKLTDELKLSFVESFKYILRSRYIGYIAIISVAYNVSINFVEVSWKSEIKKLYDSPLKIEEYFALITIYIGFLTGFMGIIGTGIIRHFSWKSTSLITPILMVILGGLFFLTTLFPENFKMISYMLGLTPLALAVWVGQAHNLVSRSCKYSFFAATREMAFIPLDAELKFKGKAAVDVLSGRVGKVGASLAQSLLLSLSALGTQGSIASYLLIFLLLIFIMWVWSINSLNKEFLKVAYGSSAAESLRK